jgi:hypothetical protein
MVLWRRDFMATGPFEPVFRLLALCERQMNSKVPKLKDKNVTGP